MVYLLGFLGIAAMVFVWPVVLFILGAFTGWVASSVFVFFGNWLVSGMALIGVKIALVDLPLLTATLGFIGGFFKSSSSSKSK